MEGTLYGPDLEAARAGTHVSMYVSDDEIQRHGSKLAALEYMARRALEMDVARDQLPWPRTMVWNESERAAVIQFLKEGLDPGLTTHYRGPSRCRICKRRNGFNEYSDGTWIWPEGLAHYVKDHSVELPQEFVSHALDADGRNGICSHQ